ncbi:MAG: triose-phosphate isomerase [Patescibacteria group bacterium]
MPQFNKKPLILANWKMNLSLADNIKLVKAVLKGVGNYINDFDIGVCPAFTALASTKELLSAKRIALGAQDVFWKGAGPYTGEISANMLQELGVKYVLIGHSERRNYLKETDQMIHHKVMSVLAAGLSPVLCVGETFIERQQGNKDLVIARQVERALAGVELAPNAELVIAYEPVWEIGSGQAVTGQEAEHTAQVILQALYDMWSPSVVGNQVRIIYGGSVDASNINDFLPSGIIAGVLVGGASLDARRFIALIKKLVN